MKQNLTLIKIGGNVIDSPGNLSRFLEDFAAISGPKLLVHGGGKIATSVAEALGIKSQFIDGRRVTSPEMMDVALMVYAGLINKKIVASLCAKGTLAIGLTGADASTVTAHKRSPEPVDYGLAGDVESVDADIISRFIDDGIVPVYCAVTCDRDGVLLNTNADTIAEELAVGLAEHFSVRLIYCFEKDGVLDRNGNVIPVITSEDFENLKNDGVVAAGMIPKIANALRAASVPGVMDVIVKNSAKLLEGSGTVITI